MKGNSVIWILVFACLGLVINAGENFPGFPLMRQSPSAVSLILPQPDSSSVSSTFFIPVSRMVQVRLEAREEEERNSGTSSRRHQLAVLRKFLEGCDLPSLHPDHQTVFLHPGLKYYLLSTPGEQYACYLEGEPEGNLTLQLPAGDYLARWHNPLNGRIIKQLEVTHPGGVLKLQAPESEGETALDLRRK